MLRAFLSFLVFSFSSSNGRDSHTGSIPTDYLGGTGSPQLHQYAPEKRSPLDAFVFDWHVLGTERNTYRVGEVAHQMGSRSYKLLLRKRLPGSIHLSYRYSIGLSRGACTPCPTDNPLVPRDDSLPKD